MINLQNPYHLSSMIALVEGLQLINHTEAGGKKFNKKYDGKVKKGKDICEDLIDFVNKKRDRIHHHLFPKLARIDGAETDQFTDIVEEDYKRIEEMEDEELFQKFLKEGK